MHGENFETLVVGTEFLNKTPKTQVTKAKNKKQVGHQTKKLLHSNGNNKMKRQPTKWGKVSANRISNKGSISKIYKELI